MKHYRVTKLLASMLILAGIIYSPLMLMPKALADNDPTLGEISITSFNYAPHGWALCNGQLLPIQQNSALYSILGTTYGGDGRTTFALPNLQGRALVGMGQGPGLQNIVEGEPGGGEVNSTQTTAQLSAHNHPLAVSANAGNTSSPINAIPAVPQTSDRQEVMAYTTGSALQTAAASMISIAGANQPQSNMQPYLGLNFIIALQGIYPSRD